MERCHSRREIFVCRAAFLPIVHKTKTEMFACKLKFSQKIQTTFVYLQDCRRTPAWVQDNGNRRTNNKNMKVAIIMGSTSDLEIMSQAINVLEGFGVEVVKRVISAHRTPDLMCEFAKSAKSEGIGVIIAGAGGAAHVAGVVAGMTTVPVIGVPIQTKALGGMDSLLSIVQMPAGIPVATMAINGAKNAGLFAAQSLALTDDALSAKLDQFRAEQTQKVLESVI